MSHHDIKTTNHNTYVITGRNSSKQQAASAGAETGEEGTFIQDAGTVSNALSVLQVLGHLNEHTDEHTDKDVSGGSKGGLRGRRLYGKQPHLLLLYSLHP